MLTLPKRRYTKSFKEGTLCHTHSIPRDLTCNCADLCFSLCIYSFFSCSPIILTHAFFNSLFSDCLCQHFSKSFALYGVLKWISYRRFSSCVFEVLKSFEQNCLSTEWKRQKTEHPQQKEKKEFCKMALKVIEEWKGDRKLSF
jgi:hypothetical protein